MKKALMILLTSVVILSSCVKEQSTNSETKNTVTEKVADPNAFHLDTLPDIGKFSGMDDEKFSPDVTEDFVPGNEYGKLIPFIGSYRMFVTPKVEGSSWSSQQGYASYGFMTADGKTVMKPSDKNSYVSCNKTDDGFCYYVISREPEQKSDAPDEVVYGETLLIPLDGSWCLKFGGNSWVSFAGGGYINVSEYPDSGEGDVTSYIYDYDGKLVKKFVGSDNVGSFSNGMFIISDWDEIGGYSVGYYDENFNLVHGPFKYATTFNEYGIAVVEDSMGACLINSDGVRISDYYKSINTSPSADMKKSVFCAKTLYDENMSDVYSEEGYYLATLTGGSYYSFRFPDNGEIFAYYNVRNDDKYEEYENKMKWIRLSDGSEFVSNDHGVSPNSYMGNENCYVYQSYEDRSAILFDGDGNTIAELDDVYDILHITPDSSHIVYLSGEYDYVYDEATQSTEITDTRVIHIYDVNQKREVYSNDKINSAYSPYAGKQRNDRFLILPLFTGDENDIFGDYSEYFLFDFSQNRMVFENLKYIHFFGVDDELYINTCTKNTSTLYDSQLNVIKKTYFD